MQKQKIFTKGVHRIQSRGK